MSSLLHNDFFSLLFIHSFFLFPFLLCGDFCVCSLSFCLRVCSLPPSSSIDWQRSSQTITERESRVWPVGQCSWGCLFNVEWWIDWGACGWRGDTLCSPHSSTHCSSHCACAFVLLFRPVIACDCLSTLKCASPHHCAVGACVVIILRDRTMSDIAEMIAGKQHTPRDVSAHWGNAGMWNFTTVTLLNWRHVVLAGCCLTRYLLLPS